MAKFFGGRKASIVALAMVLVTELVVLNKLLNLGLSMAEILTITGAIAGLGGIGAGTIAWEDRAKHQNKKD